MDSSDRRSTRRLASVPCALGLLEPNDEVASCLRLSALRGLGEAIDGFSRLHGLTVGLAPEAEREAAGHQERGHQRAACRLCAKLPGSARGDEAQRSGREWNAAPYHQVASLVEGTSSDEEIRARLLGPHRRSALEVLGQLA